MKKITIILFSLLVLFALPVALLAQDAPAGFEGSKLYKVLFPFRNGEAVRNTFEHTNVINNSTTETNGKHSLDIAIQHRFGTIYQYHDLYGVFAPSTVRLYGSYGITRDFTIGLGVRKYSASLLPDLNWKYKILQQSDKMPVTVTYGGNVAVYLAKSKDIQNTKGETNDLSRLSFFNELMVSRKINSHLSIQAGGYLSYFNRIDSASYNGEHMFFGVTAVARYKFSPQSSVILDYSHPLNVDKIAETTRPQPSLGIGLEVSTGNHQFQIFVCNASGILNQVGKLENLNKPNDFSNPKGSWLIGFNITRQWGF